MSDMKDWQSDALINIQRFLDKYSTKHTTHLPLVDVIRFRINAILGSEPEQLRWSEADAEELLGLLKAYNMCWRLSSKSCLLYTSPSPRD